MWEEEVNVGSVGISRKMYLADRIICVCMDGLETRTDLFDCAGDFNSAWIYVTYFKSNAAGNRAVSRSRFRDTAFGCGFYNEGECRHWRCGDFYDDRVLSGILGESVSDDRRICCSRRGGAVSSGAEKENEKGANTNDTVCTRIICMDVVMKRCRGSFTVEAAVIMPLFLFMLVAVISISVDLYQETTSLVAEINNKEQIDITSAMYHIDSVKKLISDLTN